MSRKKNIGFVSYWFPRGQAVVTSWIKSVFDADDKYETFVLGRRGRQTQTTGDWESKNITIGPDEHNIPEKFYLNWIKRNKIDVCFFFQNYQFSHIKKIRKMGVKTIGTFMWEQFGEPEHIIGAKSAFDVIYSLHRAEHKRYHNQFGIDSRLVRWGIHPELFESYTPYINKKEFVFHYPCGFNSPRKGTEELVKAFNAIQRPNIRLVITANNRINSIKTNGDSRIQIVGEKFKTRSELYKHFNECHATIIPSRWEGLGLAFVESFAFKKPVITTDYPPMNEYVDNGINGFIIPSIRGRKTGSGIHTVSADSKQLTKILNRMCNYNTINKLSAGSINISKRYNWKNTKKDLIGLVEKE